jgi:hypothetical protein
MDGESSSNKNNNMNSYPTIFVLQDPRANYLEKVRKNQVEPISNLLKDVFFEVYRYWCKKSRRKK